MPRWLPLLLLLVAPGCAHQGVRDERSLGQRTVQQLRLEREFLRDPLVHRYVTELGAELLRAAGPQPFRYRFYVVVDERPGGFAVPGGHVFLQSATFEAAARADELAAVLAHEIAHVVLRHVILQEDRVWQEAYRKSLRPSSLGDDRSTAYTLSRFSRRDELEADRFALGLLARAGYDPEAMARILERLARPDGGRHDWFASHPSTEQRVEAIRRELRERPGEGARPAAGDAGFAEARARVRQLTGGL